VSALSFLFGLCVGSFLNVCIHRLPRGESIIRPRSYCPKCGKPIAWYDNVPVLSFLILRGQCRGCKARISFRYPAVELISGVIWYEGWRVTGGGPIFWIQVLFLSLLLVAAVTDLETGLIPDRVTYLGMASGLAASFFYPNLQQELARVAALRESTWGLATGGGLIYVTGLVGSWIFQREAMGGGDVKLAAFIGSFLGWEKVLLVFFTAPFFALPFALYRRWLKKEEIIAYGPFLSLAGAVQFFYGGIFWNHFLGI